MNANALSNLAAIGPTRVFVNRRSRRAALGASCSSEDLARVVVEGWTRKVAATARRGGDGTKTGPEATVPEVMMFRRRLRACVSVHAVLARCFRVLRGRATDRVSLRRKSPNVGPVRKVQVWKHDRKESAPHSRLPWQ